MTTTATHRARPAAPVASSDGGALTGTPTLVRLMLRRDRVKLPAWTAGIALFWLYYTRLVPTAYPEGEGLQQAAGIMEGPLGRMWTGPGYGFDQLAFDRFLVGGYGLYVLLLAALMSILLVTRHTRVEEQTGRAELVRANVVGRHAPLTAALVVAVITNLFVSVAVFAVMAGDPIFSPGGSVLFAAGVGAVGLAFAGLAAVTVQVTEYSRAAAGLAGAGLGAAFVLRAGGDMIARGGSALSWPSPLAWSQQTAPFVLDRWWPLALSLAFAVLTSMLGYRLSARRDLGAGLVAVRPGRARAPTWLRSPLGIAWRLQRAGILGWTAAMAAAGLLFGVFADTMTDVPETILEVMGSPDDIIAGYVAFMAMFAALVIAIFAILAVQGLRTEETSGRAEPVLATPVSRAGWLGSHVGVAAVAIVVLLTVTGATTGVGAALVAGDAGLVWEASVAHLAHAPAVLVVLGLAALLFGVAPRLVPVAWVVPAYALVVGVFGTLFEAPQWVYGLNPHDHVPRFPVEELAMVPLLVLLAIAVAATVVGLVAFRRRSINVT